MVDCSCLSELCLCISAKNKLTTYSSGSLRAWLTSVLESVEQRQITLDALFPPILHSNRCGLQTANSMGPDSHFLYTEVNPTYSPCVWWNYSEFSITLESNPWTMKLILCCKQLGRFAQLALYITCTDANCCNKTMLSRSARSIRAVMLSV